MDQLETIRSRLSIEEVVGQYVQMKKSGRGFKACCPFHQEKTPSFIISPDKGLAYCFGCRKGGDIFAFIQEIENLDFPAAVRFLAEKAGVEVKSFAGSGVKKEQKEKILSLISDAQRFFRQQLEGNEAAIEYLENRGFSRKQQQELGFGFAPDSFHQLTEALKKAGHTDQDALQAGVASQKQMGDSNVYDRFRNRITFPIHDPQGKLVAFGGRTMSKDADAAKYLNSPETDYYHKGQTLYCFHRAKQAIREKDQAIIVEGYFDALTAQLYDYPQTVASLGTALTEQQVKLLGRFTKNLLFAFDADQSGQAAASRSIEIAQRLGYNVSIIRIPSGKDPDEALRNAPKEWEAAVRDAVKAMDYEFEKAFAAADKGTIDGKKLIVATLLPIVQRIPNQVEQEFYLKKLAFELETSLQSLVKEMDRTVRPAPKAKVEEEVPETRSTSYSRSEYLFGIVLNHQEYLATLNEQVKPQYLATEAEKNLYKALLAIYNQADAKKEDTALSETDPLKARLQLLELYAEEKYESFTPDQLEQEVQNLCTAIRQDYKRKRLQALGFQLAKIEREPNRSSQEVLDEYQALLADRF